MEPGLWKSTAAVWAVYGQWMAGSLLHVWPDMEPAGLRNGVSLILFFFFFCTFWDSVKLPNSFGLSFLSFTWFMSSLTLCFLRQSQSSGWMGGFGSQSAQAAAPQGPVVSNLGNYNMAGYQTQWARCNTKGVFLVCFLFGQLLWYKKGRGCIHKAFLTASFSTTGLSLQLYFTQQNYFTLNFLILYI